MMNNIVYKEFSLSEIFEVKLAKGDIKTKDCSSEYELSGIPLISAGNENNGIVGYVNKNGDNISKIFNKNCITVDMFGQAFYQPYDFYAVSHGRINVLIPKFKLTKNIGYYLATLISKQKKMFSYDSLCNSSNVLAIKIFLPCNNDKPSFDYMENYIINQFNNVENYLKKIQKIKEKNNMVNIDISNWKSFTIGELFTIKSPATRSITKYSTGNIPYVSSGGTNNGVLSYLEPKDNDILEKGNCITVSPLEGTPTFYQKDDFLGRGGAGSAVSLLYNNNINAYNALFICTIIKLFAKKFNYSDAFTSTNLRTLEILLPAKTDENTNNNYIPDWQYMEEYILNLTEKAKIQLDFLNKITK